MGRMGSETYLPIEILDYVETHAPPEESPFGISQRELAKALGYHPCSMSRPLASLVGEGYLTQGRGLVRDGVRKQLTYRITEPGRTRLRRETREVPLLSGEIPPPPTRSSDERMSSPSLRILPGKAAVSRSLTELPAWVKPHW